jgi:hypothetical protein
VPVYYLRKVVREAGQLQGCWHAILVNVISKFDYWWATALLARSFKKGRRQPTRAADGFVVLAFSPGSRASCAPSLLGGGGGGAAGGPHHKKQATREAYCFLVGDRRREEGSSLRPENGPTARPWFYSGD